MSEKNCIWGSVAYKIPKISILGEGCILSWGRRGSRAGECPDPSAEPAPCPVEAPKLVPLHPLPQQWGQDTGEPEEAPTSQVSTSTYSASLDGRQTGVGAVGGWVSHPPRDAQPSYHHGDQTPHNTQVTLQTGCCPSHQGVGERAGGSTGGGLGSWADLRVGLQLHEVPRDGGWWAPVALQYGWTGSSRRRDIFFYFLRVKHPVS